MKRTLIISLLAVIFLGFNSCQDPHLCVGKLTEGELQIGNLGCAQLLLDDGTVFELLNVDNFIETIIVSKRVKINYLKLSDKAICKDSDELVRIFCLISDLD